MPGAKVAGVHGSPSAREHGAREGGVDDDGAHAAPATAAGARQHIGGEHPAQQLGPRDPTSSDASAQAATSLNCGQPAYDDTSISMDRRALHALLLNPTGLPM